MPDGPRRSCRRGRGSSCAPLCRAPTSFWRMPPIGPTLPELSMVPVPAISAAGERAGGQLVVDPEREHQPGRRAADVARVDLDRDRELEVEPEDDAEDRPAAGRARSWPLSATWVLPRATTTSMVLLAGLLAAGRATTALVSYGCRRWRRRRRRAGASLADGASARPPRRSPSRSPGCRPPAARPRWPPAGSRPSRPGSPAAPAPRSAAAGRSRRPGRRPAAGRSTPDDVPDVDGVAGAAVDPDRREVERPRRWGRSAGREIAMIASCRCCG